MAKQNRVARYREKKKAGLCGIAYQTDSRSFLAGAWKNFPPHANELQRWKMAQNDWYFLRRVREDMGVTYA